MDERTLSKNFQKGLESQGFPCYHFPDLAFGVVKPFDFCCCCPGGLFWSVECKLTNIPSWESKAALLAPRHFRDHQINSLIKVVEQGGRASVVLFVVPPRTIDTRAWVLSARGVAARFTKGEVFRLDDLIGATRYELERIPRIGWGLSEPLHAQFTQRRYPTSLERDGQLFPEES